MITIITAVISAILGFVFAYFVWNNTPDSEEYSPMWWLTWGLAYFGLVLLIGHFSQIDSSFIGSLVVLGMLSVIVGAVFGFDDGESRVPALPMGVGFLITAAALFGANAFGLDLGYAITFLAGAGFLLAGITWLTHGLQDSRKLRKMSQSSSFGSDMRYAAKQFDQTLEVSYYDWTYSIGYAFLIVAAMFWLQAVRTPLAYLNDVIVAETNTLIQTAGNRIGAYEAARTDATESREIIRLDFSEEDTYYLTQADDHLDTAEVHITDAREDYGAAGGGELVQDVEKYSKDVESEILQLQQYARDAIQHADDALASLRSVGTLVMSLSESVIIEYLWTSYEGYWRSEQSYSPSYNACYYGERRSVVREQYELVEQEPDETGETLTVQVADTQAEQTIISDDSGGDRRGSNWKIFTVEDYYWFVEHGLIPAANVTNPTDEWVGQYLCLPEQTGAGAPPLIEEGTTLVKESGTFTFEMEDREDVFIGNYEYGSWCQTDENGTVIDIYEEGETLPESEYSWCWYQPEGESTEYYYRREYDDRSNSYIFINSYHRRCYSFTGYCSPSPWTHGYSTGYHGYVSDSRMAQASGLDRSTVRSASQIGGGPLAGK